MEITAECLNSHFITPFLLTCISIGDWFFFFFPPPPHSLCPFSFLGLHPLAFISQAAWGGWAGSGAVSGSTDVVSVESVWLRPVGAFSHGHIYRKRASEWRHQDGAVTFPHSTPSVCPYVNLTVCPLRGEASCPIFGIYFLTLPASPSRPFTVCPCRPRGLSLYIWPCCSLRAWRWDCHGYCDLLWGWQRGWNPEGGDEVWMLRRVGPRYGKHPVCHSNYTEYDCLEGPKEYKIYMNISNLVQSLKL